MISIFFFFNDTATTEIYTLSLHDALPICRVCRCHPPSSGCCCRWSRLSRWLPAYRELRWHCRQAPQVLRQKRDRKSTRLNSSHLVISYAVFCLKKKTH